MAERLDRLLFNEAKKYMPGGVNSPIRSFKAVGGEPVFIKKAKGSKLYSEDGKEFIDYCMSWGALILGHSNASVIKELKNTLNNGTSFGASTKLETDFAKLIREAMPSIEKLRLVNSGTEAVMGAVRLGRAFTKKDAIIKFKGSYHGHADYLLDCAGVPGDFKKHTIVLPYNNIRKVENTLKRHHRKIAGIIVEPVAGNIGVVLPQLEFLAGLRKLADKYNIVLIFDEVITGFRLSFGGAQGFFGVEPDLTCLGKIIGGGLPCGAYGGRADIINLAAPEGEVYQAGTFSGNPLTVSGGLAALKVLRKNNSYYDGLNRKTQYLCEEIRKSARHCNLNIKVNQVASMFSIFFTDKEVKDYETAKIQDVKLFKKFFHYLLGKGVYLSPSGFEADFLSVAHTESDVKKTVKIIKEALARL